MRDLIVRAPRTPWRLHWHCGTFAASWGTSFPRGAIFAVGGNRTFSTESALRWGNRPALLWIREEIWVLRFRLMVKRGHRWIRASGIRRRSAAWSILLHVSCR